MTFCLPRALVALSFLCCAAMSAFSADVGLSIHIAEPGVYGRVDIGRFPAPALVVAKPVFAPMPVVIGAPRVVIGAPPEPVYLWVPPGHQKHWERHCGQYHACGRPVYFVREDWYREKVMVHHVPPGQAKKGVEVEHGDHDHERDHDDDKHHGKPKKD
jgi:hypothetical protein